MKNSKHWIFDLDGTLVDSFSHYFDCLRSIFTKNGIPFTEDDIIKSLTMTASKFLHLYLEPDLAKAALAEIQTHSEETSKDVLPFEGVRTILEHLQARGDRLAVWTSRDLKSAKMILDNTGLDRYFEVCVGGTCVTQHKPHPEGLLKIAAEWKCDPDQIVMVGDHDVDMLGAETGGANAVRVSWSTTNPPECNLSDFHFVSTQEFASWLIMSST